MGFVKRLALKIDTLFETGAILALLGVILIMTLQVVTRKLFNFVFFWSEEAILLCLVWFAFMGIAIGFRENVHMGVDGFTDWMPKAVNKGIDKWINIMGIFYGVYFVIYGWEFTELMMSSTLPATKLPNAVVYLVMPVSGIMVCVYSTMQLLGFNTNRHKGADIEIGGGEEEKKDGHK